ncbi:MAG: chromate transporter [Clostridiales bacterium]|jgi:chromate transporter|nr:chromate transporter [Clostridiales bacterium]
MIAKLILLFFKIGCFSVGGGYAIMGMILQEGAAVGLTAAEFADLAALELLASGPIAINAATYVGYIKGGFLGSAAATAAICAPAFLFTSVVYIILSRYKESLYVQRFLKGISVACGGVLMSVAFTLGSDILINASFLANAPKRVINAPGAVIFALCVFASLKFKISPVIIVIASAAGGAVFAVITGA